MKEKQKTVVPEKAGGEKEDKFVPAPLYKDTLENNRRYDFVKLFEQCNNELGLQQKKRDQIITLYLAIFSFLVPFALSTAQLPMLAKGLTFIAVGIIGVLFSCITVRYRVYKEVYWLCCSTITCLMNFRQEEITKDLVQSVFYYSLDKKGSDYVVETEKDGKITKHWNKRKYFKKNIFSAETMHYMVIVLMTAAFLALGVFLICKLALLIRIAVTVAVGIVAFIILLKVYFDKCNDVYDVLWTGKDSSFIRTFSKAWFLHLYIDEKAFSKAVEDSIKEAKA